MRTITGTLSQLGTNKMNNEFNTCTKEKKKSRGTALGMVTKIGTK